MGIGGPEGSATAPPQQVNQQIRNNMNETRGALQQPSKYYNIVASLLYSKYCDKCLL